MQGATFSSAHARERDKRVEEKHKKELEEFERKIQNLKRTNDQTRKEMWEMKQGAHRLATCLGYQDLSEVQQDLDLMPEDFNFKASIGRLQAREETRDSKEEMEAQAQQLREAKKKVKELEEKLAEQSKNNAILARENAHLNEQYAALELKFKRASERFKQDYKTWRGFNNYLVGKDKKHRELRIAGNLTPGEKSRLEETHVSDQLRFMNEKGPSLAPLEGKGTDDMPPMGRTELPEELATTDLSSSDLALAASHAGEVVGSSDTEEESVVEVTPMPRRTAPATGSNSSIPPRPMDRLKQQFAPPSASPTVFSSKQCGDVAPSSETEEASDFSSPQRPPAPKPPVSKLGKEVAAASSETEEESLPVVVDLSKSSDTEESSPLEAVAPLASSISANVQRRPADRLFISERPTKMRKLSNEGEVDDVTPRKRDENSQPEELLARTDPGKATKRHSDPAVLRAPNTTVDYSIFKGKGRYGRKSEAGPSTSLNSKFVIDPVKNGGRDYQFDEVVRGRDERKKMHAGTCECCNDYYEGVGPLPPRLQPPLWRSPPKKSCQSLDDFDDTPSSSRRQHEIESHKKNISRHRHTWERAKTPPKYWDIGFPSTQEAGEINEQAERMHQEKLEEVAKEAASGAGRYKRRS